MFSKWLVQENNETNGNNIMQKIETTRNRDEMNINSGKPLEVLGDAAGFSDEAQLSVMVFL